MEEIFWSILTDFAVLLPSLIGLRVVFDYMRMFIFGGGK